MAFNTVYHIIQDTNLGTPLYEVEATDDDTGNNAQILYFIAGESVRTGCCTDLSVLQ